MEVRACHDPCLMADKGLHLWDACSQRGVWRICGKRRWIQVHMGGLSCEMAHLTSCELDLLILALLFCLVVLLQAHATLSVLASWRLGVWLRARRDGQVTELCETEGMPADPSI